MSIELNISDKIPQVSRQIDLSNFVTPTPTPTKKPSLLTKPVDVLNQQTAIIVTPELVTKNKNVLLQIDQINNTTLSETLIVDNSIKTSDVITLISLQKNDNSFISEFNNTIIINKETITAIFFIPEKFISSEFKIVKFFGDYWKIVDIKNESKFISIEFGPFTVNQLETISIGVISNKEVINFVNNTKSIPQNRSDFISLIYKVDISLTPTPVPTITPTPTPTVAIVTPTPTPTNIPQVTTKAKVVIPTPTPTPTIVNIINDPSITTTIFLSSKKESVSPIIDTQRLSYTLVHNLINKLITQEEIDSELLPSGGLAKARYIVSPVKINSDILASRFYISFSANVPEETLLRIYYRVYNSIEDPTSFITDKSWTMIGTSGTRNTYGTEKIDFEFEVEEIEYDGNTTLKEFDWFSIKIVKESSNESIIPKVSEFRVMALS